MSRNAPHHDAAAAPMFESLEGRQMFSAPSEAIEPMKKPAPTVPNQIIVERTRGGTLVIRGTDKRDRIRVANEADGLIHVKVPRSEGSKKFRSIAAFKPGRITGAVIISNGGNDEIALRGLYRRAIVDAGPGDDRVDGTDFEDFIEGGAGDDEVHSFDGDDTVYGDGGDDKVFGGDGNDELNGGGGKDAIAGQSGDDSLVSRDGGLTDYISGGLGVDVCVADRNTAYEDDGYYEFGDPFFLRDIEHISG
jgi:Ca2+-binding RTX toxin-like protein